MPLFHRDEEGNDVPEKIIVFFEDTEEVCVCVCVCMGIFRLYTELYYTRACACAHAHVLVQYSMPINATLDFSNRYSTHHPSPSPYPSVLRPHPHPHPHPPKRAQVIT